MSEITAAPAKARYIDVAEAAKMLRPVLKKSFPGVKFSVRIDRYSMGSSIDVTWTDGPTEEDVRNAAYGFKGGRFEAMTDCSYSADSWYCVKHGARSAQTYGSDIAQDNGPTNSRCCAEAELVHFSTTSLGTNRTLSQTFKIELLDAVVRACGLDAETVNMDTLLPAGAIFAHGPWDTVADAIYRLSVRTSR